MNDTKTIFVEFTKKDDDQRTVAGYASTEALDSQDEIVEKDAIAGALQGYLGEFDQKTGKYRYGNLREMHQLSAVGKTMKAKVDDKGLYIEGKVVDDNAWKKVKEGVYAGFSIGGKIIEQVKNRIKALKLSEISLVDRPANPEAVFAMVKVDDKGKIKEMQKDMGELVATDEKPVEIPGEEVTRAGYILDLAREIRRMLADAIWSGTSTTELNSVLNALKVLAVKTLNGEDKKKFDKILYGINFTTLKRYNDLPETKEEKVDIKKYLNNSWVPGYFENMRKVMN